MARSYALQAYFGSTGEDLIAYIPHASSLGMTVVDVGPCFAVIRQPYREDLIGDPTTGVVFGGVITSLLDQTAGLAASCSLETLQAIATIDLRIDYLRAADPGCDLIARAECYKLTTHVAFVRGIAYDRTPDDPFASCIATFMVGANTSLSAFAGDVPGPQERQS